MGDVGKDLFDGVSRRKNLLSPDCCERATNLPRPRPLRLLLRIKEASQGVKSAQIFETCKLSLLINCDEGTPEHWRLSDVFRV